MADKPKVKPSSAGVWIGLVMMLLSFASCGAGCVLAGSEIKDAADAAQRVDVPASQTYDMEADAAWNILRADPTGTAWHVCTDMDTPTAWAVFSDIIPEPVRLFLAPGRQFIINAASRVLIITKPRP